MYFVTKCEGEASSMAYFSDYVLAFHDGRIKQPKHVVEK
jgi:hypothetical protein